MMTPTDFIVDVTEADFEFQVIAYSQQTPVLVDFWAEWCVPCRLLSPVLEKLAHEARGGFRLAKVNVDENPNLAQQFQVRSIPSVKAFQNGRVVAEFQGAQPEFKVREFLRGIVPSQDDLTIEKGNSLLQTQQPKTAEKAFQKVLENSPSNTAALIGLVKSVLMQGRGSEGKALLQSFPPSREYSTAEKIRPLAEALVRIEDNYPLNDDPLDAAFYNSLRLAKRGNLEAALDGLLDILKQDKHYRGGEVRQVFLGLLELLGEGNPVTRQYRNELASVLF